jgi:hypothetical protein
VILEKVQAMNTEQRARPATVFLSYAHEDAQEMALLQQYLMLRGVHAWRDATHLELGSYTREEIAGSIENEVDAFLLYVTPPCLASHFIWDEEVPAALRRWERDQRFSIIPVFRGVSIAEFQLFCANRGYARRDHSPLYEFAGVVIPEGQDEAGESSINTALQQVALRVLRAALKQRFRRVQAGSDYEPWLYLHTYPRKPPYETLDLDLDWAARFDGRLPDQQECQHLLLPALRDVKNVLSEMRHSQTLHLGVQTQLSAAVALGASFPSTAGFTLLVEGQQGAWRSEPRTSTMAKPLPRKQYPLGEGAAAVVEVAIARDTTQVVSKALQQWELTYRYRIRLGNGKHIVGDSAEAATMAAQVGAELRHLHDRTAVPYVHLFLSTPAPLAVLIGNQLNAAGPVTVYHHQKPDGQSDERYLPAFTL